MRPRLVALVVGLASTLATGVAAAEELRLSWRAPQGCPTEVEVREAALRSAKIGATRAPLDAQVSVEHGERWTVTIRTQRAGLAAPERHLDATSCGALADATAVILAMALVPPADVPETPTPTPTPTPTSSAPPDPDRGAASSPRAPVVPHALALSAALGTDGTTLPAPALGGRAGLAWTPSRARLELSGAAFSSQSKTTSTSSAGATFTLLVAGARGCWAVTRGDVELSPCAGADVQVVRARGYGATANYDASAAWLSATGGVLVRVPVTDWLALRGDVDATVPLARPQFVVEGDGAVHRPASIGVRAGIGAELLFL